MIVNPDKFQAIVFGKYKSGNAEVKLENSSGPIN